MVASKSQSSDRVLNTGKRERARRRLLGKSISPPTWVLPHVNEFTHEVVLVHLNRTLS